MPDPPKHIPEDFGRIVQVSDRIGHNREARRAKFAHLTTRIAQFPEGLIHLIFPRRIS